MKTSRSGPMKGFTLIEIMIVVALIAILSAVAMPAYNNYINRGHIKTAQADLIALSLNLENFYQKRLAYPAFPEADTDTTTEVKTKFSGWSPAAGDRFIYSTKNGGVGTETAGYSVVATGSAGGVKDCVLSMTHEGEKTLTACAYGNGKWL